MFETEKESKLIPEELPDQSKRGVLKLLPEKRQGVVSGYFYNAVRKGLGSDKSIIEYVIHKCSKKKDREAIPIIRDNLDLVTDFIDYVRQREPLPQDLKKERKKQKSEPYKEKYLKEQPPTQKQVSYLKNLGYMGEIESKWQATKLIDKMLKN